MPRFLVCPNCGYDGDARRQNKGRPQKDFVGYDAMHSRLNVLWPREERTCEEAGIDCEGRIEAALKTDTPEERVHTSNSNKRWSLDPADYRLLCRYHHKEYG